MQVNKMLTSVESAATGRADFPVFLLWMFRWETAQNLKGPGSSTAAECTLLDLLWNRKSRYLRFGFIREQHFFLTQSPFLLLVVLLPRCGLLF